MKNLLILTIVLTSFLSFARKPAVESHVGVINQEEFPMNTTPTRFNLIKAQQQVLAQSSEGFPMTSVTGLLLFLLLPTISWFAIREANKLSSGGKSQPPIHNNVESLDAYRDKKKIDTSSHDDDDIKKAS